MSCASSLRTMTPEAFEKMVKGYVDEDSGGSKGFKSELDKTNVVGSFYDPREGLRVITVSRSRIHNNRLTTA